MKTEQKIKEIFERVDVKTEPPEHFGWYNTDKGQLFYSNESGPFMKEGWSFRDDRMSEEYPNYWYKKISFLIPKWRKVEEELPEETKGGEIFSEPVFTLIRLGKSIFAHENEWNFELKCWANSHRNVIAWMPKNQFLPESELLNLMPK